jgi:hypothetical protein
LLDQLVVHCDECVFICTAPRQQWRRMIAREAVMREVRVKAIAEVVKVEAYRSKNGSSLITTLW